MKNIEKKILLNADILKVWKAITDPAELEKWMLMSTDFKLEEGSKFTFKAEPNENWDGIIRCQIKEIVKNKKLVFTWNSDMINAETLISISLKKIEDKTELILIHSGWERLLADAELMKEKHNEGWELRLSEKLKSIVE